MKAVRFTVLCLILAIAVAPATSTMADEQETLLNQLRDTFKKDYLSVGALMQVVGDVQPERTLPGRNGYSIANMRVSLTGKLDRGFGYFIQANLINTPALLDARLDWQTNEAFRLSVGKFKAPFSKELLTVASDIDFVNRARMIQAFSPGRQIGMMFSGWLGDRQIYYAAGMFNGNKSSINSNDNNDFLFAGRVAAHPRVFDAPDAGDLEVGVSAAHSSDSEFDLPDSDLPAFTGKRLLLGGDLRLTCKRWLLAGEGLYTELEPGEGESMEPYGFHATVGYMATDNIQLLGRWDSYNLDDLLVENPDSDWLILGVNYWPTGATELQVNYIVDIDSSDFDHHQVLVNVQVVF